MEKRLLSGNEAIARGIYESGIQVAAAYPGTPSTEILEAVAHNYPEVTAQWAPNEKVAFDVAVGAAYGGRRSIAVMKHVGVNVAAEVLFYSSYTGANAGLVVITADDPGLHSSQNEQDNRHYARFAKVPMLEPANSQEAKDMIIVGIEISEQFDTPVMLRTTTRISHAKSVVTFGERPPEPEEPYDYQTNPTKYVMIPAFARRRHPIIEERMCKLAEYAEEFPHNHIEMRNPSLGIITSGTAYQYCREVFPEASTLKLGMVWPLPTELIQEFTSRVERVVVVEELDPFLEENVRLMGVEAEGKSIFPMVNEFTPERVRQSAYEGGLSDKPAYTPAFSVPNLPMRPPILCAGCPHRGVFRVLKKLRLIVNSDIGCYALGVLPPLAITDSCGCMGASIGVGHGVTLAGLERKNVAVIGDSTFFHAGLPALANVIYNQGNLLTIIVDNHTTAMTGHQGHPGTGVMLDGTLSRKIDFVELAKGMGVEVVERANPADLKSFEEAVRRCLDANASAVLVADAPCVFADYERRPAYTVGEDICNGCTLCFRVGCPAIGKSDTLDEKSGRPKAVIDPLLCYGCDLCAQVCAHGAITPGG